MDHLTGRFARDREASSKRKRKQKCKNRKKRSNRILKEEKVRDVDEVREIRTNMIRERLSEQSKRRTYAMEAMCIQSGCKEYTSMVEL